jgi:hypothetical protein
VCTQVLDDRLGDTRSEPVIFPGIVINRRQRLKRVCDAHEQCCCCKAILLCKCWIGEEVIKGEHVLARET